MSKSSSKLSSTVIIVLACLAWAIFSLVFFLLFSVPAEGGEPSQWYLNSITVLELGAFLAATIFCLRNWRSAQIVSGRNVWLAIGLGMLCYTLGNVLFYLWNSVWGLDPAVSLGDFFYILSYLFLGWGMLQAVLPRRLNLEVKQWALIAGVGLLGVLLAYMLNYRLVAAEIGSEAANSTPAVAQSTPAAGAPAAGSPASTPGITASPAPAPEVDPPSAPPWVAALDTQLSPFADFVGLLYVVGDCILVVIATTLLVAFWGGKFSQSWKLIAVAAFCLYIADMFFAYNNGLDQYVEGSLWEVFWTFSAIFFALGAVVEHEISTRSRRTSRRRR